MISYDAIDKSYLFKIEFSLVMRDVILLLCRNVDLRRLYHELLERENALVHDVEKIEDLLAIGSVHEYTKMALYVDDQPIAEGWRTD